MMTVKTRLMMLALVGALAVTTAVPAAASPRQRAQVTHGEFVTLQGGTDNGYSVEGRALMVRIFDRTYVVVRARGLDANTTYPTHVHNAPCADPTFGGGHYQHEVGGDVDGANEMWPFISTNRAGNGTGMARHDHRARADAMSIVIHYPENTSIRLACVDLS